MTRLILRLALGILITVLAAYFIGLWGFRVASHAFFEETLPRVTSRALQTRRQLEATPAARLTAEVTRLQAKNGVPLRLLSPRPPEVPPRVLRRLRQGHAYVFHGRPLRQGRRGRRVLFVDLPSHGKVLRVGPLPSLESRAYPLLRVVAGIVGVVALTALLLGLPLVRRLRRLERVAQRISEGDLQARAEEGRSSDSIGSLARRFNLMADRVQELLEHQRQLLQAVSHELRTPIARIRFGLEILDQSEEPADRRRRSRELEGDLAELELLLDELLFFIKAGDRALELRLEDLPARQSLEALAPRLSELHPERQVEVQGGGEQDLIRADPRLFRRAMGNLISNALRHAAGRVVVRLEDAPDGLGPAGASPKGAADLGGGGGALRVDVCDDGEGIPEDQRLRVFEPFSRLDPSRSREQGGVGLGLAIVRQVLRAHGGRVWVEPAPEGGARFCTAWPRASTKKTPAASGQRPT